MRFWKFVLSKIEGRKPTVNQLDHETIAKNIRSGALYVLRESDAGVKEVIEVAGGPPGTGESHLRAHQIDSIEDHPPVPEGKRGKIVATDPVTGEMELIDKNQIALDVYSEDDGFYPVETIYKKFPESNAERITTIQKPQGLMYGGKVSWLDGMLFAVSGAIYFIRGELYKADDLIITLQASNPDNPRIDVIVATEDNEFSVITGTPAANALKPYINPITQVEIAEILIPAGATGFGGLIFRNVIYNENTEWAGTGVGVVVDFDSTADPYFGLKCADVGNIQTADYVKFESAGNVSIVDFDLLHLALKFKFNVTTLSALLVEFYLDGVLVSSPRNVPFLSGPDKWQHISIEMSSISFSDAFYNEIRFVWFYPIAGGVAYQPGFYLDYIRLEKGISPPPTPTTIYLAGDVSGSGSVGHPIRTTLRTVNSNVGTFGSTTKIPKVTVNKKGLVTAVEEVDAEGGGTDSAFVYIAYASDASGTGFTLTFDSALDYIAILSTDTEIATPVVTDFTGLWKKYKGDDGVGVPTGGTTGQVLKKQSATDYDTAWDDESGGSGGSTELTSIPATNQTASGITTTFTANESQAFGDVVRLNSSGKAQIAKADVIANATALAMLIDDEVEADATGHYLLIGFVRDDAWNWSIGAWIYLTITGTTGNTLTQTSPFDADPIVEDTVVQLLGVANTADTFYFNPQLVQVELKPE
ncbi:hypothetical protein [Massilibacteroides sp.]|uniref:hypothetical protein n=1 Tax=Massilibacteroides sp. TaxID=2034766 RepID=UPI002628468A|nr:hypothetical protein [Massilibacteroides sp.]MDD4515408.1 hypothetical protein [Massilibacteroides sp.]